MKEKTRKLRGWRSHTSEGKTLPLPHKRRTFDSPQQPHVSGEEVAVGQTAPRVEPRSVIRRRCTGTHSLFGFGMAAVFQRFILPPPLLIQRWRHGGMRGTPWLAPMASPRCSQPAHSARPPGVSPGWFRWTRPLQTVLPLQLTTDGSVRVPTAAVFRGLRDAVSSC